MNNNFFDLLDNFNEKVGGVSFINVRGYVSKSTNYSVSRDFLVNIGVDYGKAVKKDIETLKAITDENLVALISKVDSKRRVKNDEKITLAVMKIALTSALQSLESPSFNHSQGQKNAKIKLTPNGSLSYYKETGNINIFAHKVNIANEEILNTEEYNMYNSKKANKVSRSDIVAKETIVRELKLRTSKFINLTFGQMAEIKVNGDTIEVNADK